jgi:hypothetical protein
MPRSVRPWFAPPGRGRKTWSGEPPFWAVDALSWPWMAAQQPDRERIENNFEGYVQGAYKNNGVVFSCIDRRQQVFSQARFQWRQFRNGRPSDLFGSPELSLLENPWPNGTTGELLSHMESDASLAGQFYCTTVDEAGRIGRTATGAGRRIARMRPDWTSLIIDAPSGNPFNLDARVVAYLYEPKAGLPTGGRSDSVTLLPDEVCHYSPKPDPMARFRGMSWLTPILQEILADRAATRHKFKFFDNGAVPNMAIKFDKDTKPETFEQFVQKVQRRAPRRRQRLQNPFPRRRRRRHPAIDGFQATRLQSHARRRGNPDRHGRRRARGHSRRIGRASGLVAEHRELRLCAQAVRRLDDA